MIVTKNWLNEWIDLDNVTTEQLLKTLNAIGLEVSRHESICVPKGVVVGFVEGCEKHPDADKLNVCQVNLGDEICQIVCGASNVRAGIYVAVATLGTQLPSGLTIKEAKLRGMESHGMICSSTEIGLPKMGEGIMILDKSIGELINGKNLSEYDAFSDDIIEIELTANRGDCLSIRGVARDLCAALSKNLREITMTVEAEGRLGIGRILQLQHTEPSHVELLYGAVEIKKLTLPFLVALRMAMVEKSFANTMDTLLGYVTHSTGVIVSAYPFSAFQEASNGKAVITLAQESHGYNAIFGQTQLSVVGVSQNEEVRFGESDGLAVIEASYISPEVIAKKMSETKIASSAVYYHASRGSEPTLKIGIDYAMKLLEQSSVSLIYGGNLELRSPKETTIITLHEEEFESFIGMKIDKLTITQILKNLGMSLSKPSPSAFAISVPCFRHDILTKQDIIEEIVRIIGIDKIPSKPFAFCEKNRHTTDFEAYKKNRIYRHRSAQNGFFESVHFIFNERTACERFGFICTDADKELLNPITATLDTLRPTLLIGLLNAASLNSKSNQKKIALFESGMIFDPQRQEKKRIAFLMSGAVEGEKIANGGKPPMVDFQGFVQKISDVIGSFEMIPFVPEHTLAHPYISAKVMMEGKTIGELFRLHPSVEEEFDLPITFMCELDMDALPYGLVEAHPFSKYQPSFRDLSLIVPKTLPYERIKAVIAKHASADVKRFYPVDRYESETLGDQVSLSVRFMLQSEEKTLEEEDITAAVEWILTGLNEELGIGLR